jgi:hypothetical protein
VLEKLIFCQFLVAFYIQIFYFKKSDKFKDIPPFLKLTEDRMLGIIGPIGKPGRAEEIGLLLLFEV